ncbi:MAG: DivIVA domain-containing protein [Oscillospiraceae bacterium]|nr:DivIVA domain-containing protein [Oscillospiraceae bacterium]
MFTPQQIDQVSFSRVPFGGYDIQSVDEFLGPLTEDYVTLYKENALLKSKMKVLVSKLEEYRNNEASMKDAIVNAQKTCDLMVKEAEAKCTQMLNDANAAAMENAKNANALIAAENDRVDEARRNAAAKIVDLQDQLKTCIQALDRIKEAHRPSPATNASGNTAFDYDRTEGSNKASDAMADEISANLQALVGTTDEDAPKAEPKHPVSDTTTSKFTNLQFGKNYDPTHR